MRTLALCLLAALSAPAADSTLMQLVMPDARVIAGANVVQARTSAFGQFLLSQAQATDPHFQEFVQTTGFDPRYNIDQVLYASPGGKQHQAQLVLARGSFNPAAITKAATDAGARTSTYKGVTLIHAPMHQHAPAMSLAFLDSSLAIAGDTNSVQSAIDRSQGTPGGPSAALREQANTVSAVQDAWFVSQVPVSEFAAQVPDGGPNGMLKGQALQSISQVSGGVKFGDIVRLSAAIVTQTAQDASSLGDVLRFLAGLAQMRHGPDQTTPSPLQTLLSSLTLTPSGNTLAAGLAIPEADLEKLVQQQHGRRIAH